MNEYVVAVGTRAGINTADAAYFQIRPNAATKTIKVLYAAITITTAPTNAPVFYMARSSAIGTQTATVAGLPVDPGGAASVVNVDTAFSADPTIVVANKLAIAVTGTGANDRIFDFRANPIILAADTTDGLVIANAVAAGATVGAFSLTLLWREG